MWNNYVIDGTLSNLDEGMVCVCPVELDEKGNITNIVVGMNIITSPEGALQDYNIVAVVHEDGNQAVVEFYEKMRKAGHVK